MARGAQHWAAVREAGSVLGIRFLFQVHRLFGRSVFRAVLYLVLGYYFATRADARRASGEYLARLRACAPTALPRRWPRWRHFVAFGESLLDRLLAWAGATAPSELAVDGSEQLLAAVASGQGGVILTAHLGSGDLAWALGQRIAGFRLTVLVHIEDQDRFNRVKRRVNADSQRAMLQVARLTPAIGMLLAERVDRGEFVMIAGDRLPLNDGGSVVMTPFLGRAAPLPAGPYLLAGALRCPVFAYWCVRRGDGHTAVFRRLGVAAGRRTLVPLATAFAATLEQGCVQTPLQWFNFFRFWDLPRGRSYVVTGRD